MPKHLYTISDPNSCYDFHDVILVQDELSGRFFAAHDSGCSCPVPFENHTFPTDYTEVRTQQEFRDYVKDVAGDYVKYEQRDIDEAAAFLPN